MVAQALWVCGLAAPKLKPQSGAPQSLGFSDLRLLRVRRLIAVFKTYATTLLAIAQ
jgi:hypothetical protein